jgi:Glycosyltransferase family 25 (LPS biosynthesis protein)
MKIKNFFERIYVVNLPERTDRRRTIALELAKAGLPLTPNQIEIFPAIRPESAGEFPNIGARGCFLSHLAILKQAKQDCLSNILIVEDDLVISELFKQQEDALINQLQQTDWGFVYFGHSLKLESLKHQPLEFANKLAAANSKVRLQPCSESFQTTHFYGVNGTVIDRLIGFLEEVQRRPAGHPDGGPMHVDGAYNHFREQNPDVLTLLAFPNLGTQQNSRSDITPSWRDRAPLVRDLVGVARLGKVWLHNHSIRQA